MMRRDMELVRRILFEIENGNLGHGGAFHVEGYADVLVGYHVTIMAEGGLLVAHDVTSFDDAIAQSIPVRMTWLGHEFIDAARNETVWAKARALIGSGTSAAWVQALTQVAFEVIQRAKQP